MKFGTFAATGVLSFAAVLGAQTPATQQPAQQQTQPSSQPGQPPAKSNGKVLFSRSVDENGETQTQADGAAQLAKAPVAEDAERAAITFTNYDLDVRLRSDEHRIAVRALVTVRNDGKEPLKRIPLQISSTLNWERVRVAGPNGMQDVPFQAATLNSDADHTGQLHEAAIPLPVPLAPGATVRVDAAYSGVIEQSAQRLVAVGTPEDLAQHSDWDRIDTDFIGLRGFGNVAWYPVAAVPVVLGDGARLFDEIGEQKQRNASAKFRLRLTVEFPHGQAPTVALVNGHPVELKITDSATAGEDVPGVATAELPASVLGFEAPSLFVAVRTAHAGANLTAWTRAEDDAYASSWTLAEKNVTLFMLQWLGDKPRAQLTLLDLPEVEDLPFEAGAMLATGIQDGDPEKLKAILVHALTHAWIAQGSNSAAWLNEGVAYFLGSVWTERQQGRDKALQMLEAGRPALALVEPASPGQGVGEPLSAASQPVYYRTKAAYVLWMLRGITSDDAMAAALRGLDSVGLEAGLEKAANTDLKWFFADWVDADHGLPDLSVEDVFSSPEQSGNWLVAPHLSNAGYAAAEVPVAVRTVTGTSITQRVRIPARGTVVPRILIQGKPVEVQVNDGTVPETGASVHVTKMDTAPPAPSSAPVMKQP